MVEPNVVPNPAAARAEPAHSPRVPAAPSLAGRIAGRLPDWAGSIRFRIAVLYSLVLFGLAAVMITSLYLVLARRLHEERVYLTYQVTEVQQVPGGFQLAPRRVRAEYRSVEQLANERSLALLRDYSIKALLVLFLASLIVGWLLAGRALAPIGRITSVAREIEAGDLTRRIDLRGPPDELKELADTFDAMLDRIDDAFAGQRRFIQEASHELRNPLAVIRTNLDVALADPDADPAELRRTAEVVNRTASRMSRLVDDLLSYARSGSPGHVVAPVDVAKLVTEVAEEFVAPAAMRRLDIVALVSPVLEGDQPILGDRVALRQAVANLLTNAVRLAPEGSVITVGAVVEGEVVAVSVADEGPGIAPEHRELVFQRFWRADRSGPGSEGRSGLGLAIVSQIAADHGGTVELTDSAQGGSVFTIRMPMRATTSP